MSHEKQGSDLKIGLIGLGLGLAWVFLVGAISHFLAL